MAIISCRECKKPVSDQAATCPSCGAPVRDVRFADTEPAASRVHPALRIFGWLFLALIVFLFLFRDNGPVPLWAPEKVKSDRGFSAGVLECSDNYVRRAAKEPASHYNWQELLQLCRELTKVADSISEDAYGDYLKALSVLRWNGYADPNAAYQVARVLELRGSQTSEDIKAHLDEVVKIYIGTKGRVTPNDLLQFPAPAWTRARRRAVERRLFQFGGLNRRIEASQRRMNFIDPHESANPPTSRV
jgi:hypothetical protein